MSHSKNKSLAIWVRRLLLIGFILSVLAYIVLFIVPSFFNLKVITAPQLEQSNEKSLYYIATIKQEAIKAQDILVYIDYQEEIQTTQVTQVAHATVKTLAGEIKYRQILGQSKMSIPFLGTFYDKCTSIRGRFITIVYVFLMLFVNRMMTFLIRRQSQKEEEDSVAEVETELTHAIVAPYDSLDADDFELETNKNTNSELSEKDDDAEQLVVGDNFGDFGDLRRFYEMSGQGLNDPLDEVDDATELDDQVSVDHVLLNYLINHWEFGNITDNMSVSKKIEEKPSKVIGVVSKSKVSDKAVKNKSVRPDVATSPVKEKKQVAIPIAEKKGLFGRYKGRHG